jgi:hypothetical protein
LLVGDANGNVQVYLNTNNNSEPIFAEGLFIQANEANINVGERATPVADDWNDDGKKDLIIGNMKGNIVIYLNKGSDSVPAFDSPFLLQVDGKVFDAGTRSAPRIYDWNKDGLKDLLIGEMDGYVFYLKNIGTRKTPLFNKAEKLVLGNGDFLRYPDPTGNPRSRLFVTDWNNDGLDDILLSGRDGRVMLFLAASETSNSLGAFARRIWNQSKETFIKLKNKSIEKIRGLKKRFS